MIEFKSVSKFFKVQNKEVYALNNVSLTVKKGTIYGVVGTSGAGKSTLIRCINLLEQPTSGSVLINGQSLIQMKKRELQKARADIGMIFQHFNLLSNRSVFHNIALPLKLQKKSKEQIKEKVTKLLELTGLNGKEYNYPAQLSGGQKQRVAIARALACDPKLLLCDEATSALDPETTQSILALLKDLNKQLGITILLITHEMEVIKSICDRVAVMQDGQIIEENKVTDFFVQPKTNLGRRFVSDIIHEKSLEEINLALDLTLDGKGHPVVRLTFVGKHVNDACLSKISEALNVNFNILQASIETISSKVLGFLTAEIIGNKVATQGAIAALQNEAEVEIIGYVQ